MADTFLKVVWLSLFISENKHFFVLHRPTGWQTDIGLVIACLALYT